MARRGNYVKKDGLGKEFTAILKSISKGGKLIRGSLTVAPGHSYWWFAEFGTGIFHEEDDADEVRQPGATKQAAVGGPYIISAKRRKYLVYVDRSGRVIRDTDVEHTGSKPQSFLRISVFESQQDFRAELKVLSKGGHRLPRREELVELVNDILAILIVRLRARTPDGDENDPNPYHEGRHRIPLRDAWDIKEAK